jgi:hypothetical protein
MAQATMMTRQELTRSPRVLPRAPEELTQGKLVRLGEGIGKVVYGSRHWVIKRERTPSEIIALIIVWKILKALSHIIPGHAIDRLLEKPSNEVRVLRVMIQTLTAIVPKSLWFMTDIGEVWRVYHWRNVRGESLAQAHLTGTELVPERVMFPPTRVKIEGWPGWLMVHEATERVDSTLDQRLRDLAGEGRYEEVEKWLTRLLNLRENGWRRGLFSVDAHLKNFGVCGQNLVLLDSGGLTNAWADIQDRLEFEESVECPHEQLGLEPILKSRPDVAKRFNMRWKEIVNREYVQLQWLGDL